MSKRRASSCIARSRRRCGPETSARQRPFATGPSPIVTWRLASIFMRRWNLCAARSLRSLKRTRINVAGNVFGGVARTSLAAYRLSKPNQRAQGMQEIGSESRVGRIFPRGVRTRAWVTGAILLGIALIFWRAFNVLFLFFLSALFALVLRGISDWSVRR